MCFKKIFSCFYGDDSCTYIYDVLENITDIVLRRNEKDNRYFKSEELKLSDDQKRQWALMHYCAWV